MTRTLFLFLLLTGTPATAQTELSPGDAAGGDLFGHSVDLFADTLVVGSYFDDDLGFASGSAYVFVRSGADWSEEDKLIASDGLVAQRFGWDVAVDGDTAVVSALFGNGVANVSGAAYVFVRSGTSWTEEAKLVSADGAMSDWFGRSVSISGDTVAIGAPQDDDQGNESGSAYVFVRTGTSWSEQDKLIAMDTTTDDEFGQAVTVVGDTVIVGAPEHNQVGSNSGSAYVFTRTGTTWSETAELTPVGLQSNARLGFAVDFDGTRAILGAYQDADFPFATNIGAAYVFVQRGTNWIEEGKLLASDAESGDQFGWSVAIDDDRAIAGARFADVVGTSSGAGYLFARSGSSWSEVSKLSPADAAANDELGISVTVEGETAVLGAYKDDVVGGNSGSAYVYELGLGTGYCVAAPNSASDGATLFGSGSPAIADNDITLFVQGLPAVEPGLFYYGPTQIQAPFGDGIRCVGGTVVRIQPPIASDAAGTVTRALDLTLPPIAGTIAAGTDSNFQFWYRDPAGGPSGFNLSDAVGVTWQ